MNKCPWQNEEIEAALERVKQQNNWIKFTDRVNELRFVTVAGKSIENSFNFNHHVQASQALWPKIFSRLKRIAVVFGQKNQGKSQFLFFLLRLLQQLGELVVYLDQTILPLPKEREGDDALMDDDDDYCVNYWKDELINMLPDIPLKSMVETFASTRKLDDFSSFMILLKTFAKRKQKNQRVWLIIDEAPALESNSHKNPFIPFPEEQTSTPFSFIVAGSAEIGSWVGKRHLERYVFDLPTFNKEEGLAYATTLVDCLGKSVDELAEYLCVPNEGIADCLEETFGGVPGYIAESFLSFHNKEVFSDYARHLSDRVDGIIRKTAEKRSLSVEALCTDWIRAIQFNFWQSVQDSGLCGSGPPRGIILKILLKHLTAMSPNAIDELLFVQRLCSTYGCGDAGLDAKTESGSIPRKKARK